MEIDRKQGLPFTSQNLWSLPATTVMVSCVGRSGIPNIITIAACGIASSSPPLISLAIGVNQYSLKLIKETKDFVVNIPSHDQVRITDWCGSFTGKSVNKFVHGRLTPGKSVKVKSPYIIECPVSYECTLWRTVDCGNHELLLGEIQFVHIDKDKLNKSKDGVDSSRFNPLVSFQQEYWSLGNRIAEWHCAREKAG